MNPVPMDVDEAVRRRRTTRAFDPDAAVSDDDLTVVVTAGLRTPSAGWTQAVELLVLAAPADRDRYWRLTADPDRAADRWLRGMMAASALVLVWTSEQAYRDRYAEPDKGWEGEDRWSAPYWWVDAGMAVQTMLLAATARGLASAFVGVPRTAQAAVAAAFGVPSAHQSVGLVALGHAPAGHRPSAPRRPRRPDADRIHLGQWASAGEGDGRVSLG